MKKDLCLSISEDNYLFNNKTYDHKLLLKIIPYNCLPYIMHTKTEICGPFIKLIEEFALKYGYKYKNFTLNLKFKFIKKIYKMQ
jgi:hypothetical protein